MFQTVFFRFPWDNLVQLGIFSPWGVSFTLAPDLDEGSPTGHLWWSLIGGEVTYMCHILRGRCEP